MAIIIYNPDISNIFLLFTLLYYYLTALIIFFLSFFTNEHNKTFKKTSVITIKLTKSLDRHRTIIEILKSNRIKIFNLALIFFLMPTSLFPLTYFSKCSTYSIEKAYDYIVVLGNKSVGNEPSEDMECRLDCLMNYIDTSPNAIIVLTGGNDEAEIMNTFLIDNDINNQTILEKNSKNTHENIENIKR